MPIKFTPLHLTILIDAYTGAEPHYRDSPASKEFISQMVKQGLVYIKEGEVKVTAYGSRKLEELFLTLNMPAENK